MCLSEHYNCKKNCNVSFAKYVEQSNSNPVVFLRIFEGQVVLPDVTYSIICDLVKDVKYLLRQCRDNLAYFDAAYYRYGYRGSNIYYV